MSRCIHPSFNSSIVGSLSWAGETPWHMELSASTLTECRDSSSKRPTYLLGYSLQWRYFTYGLRDSDSSNLLSITPYISTPLVMSQLPAFDWLGYGLDMTTLRPFDLKAVSSTVFGSLLKPILSLRRSLSLSRKRNGLLRLTRIRGRILSRLVGLSVARRRVTLTP